MIIQHINDLYPLLIKQYKEKREKYISKNKIYISTLSASKCDRKIRYIFDGVTKDKDLSLWLGLEAEIGEQIHQFYQKQMLDNGILKFVEKKVSIE